MKIAITLGLALFGSAAVVTDTPRFAPAAGSALERTTTWTESMETVTVEILEDGVKTGEIPKAESAIERTLSITTIDTHLRSAPNLPLELTRVFDDVTLEMEAEVTLVTGQGDVELTVAGEGESLLESIGVRFVWDAEKEEWKKTYADDFEASPELLDPLKPNAEFIALLPDPDTDIKVGARWEVDTSVLTEILVPGGSVPLERMTDLTAIEGVLDPLLLPGPFDILGGEIEGEIEAHLVAIVDGIAEIELTVDVQIATEVIEQINELLEGAVPDEATVEVLRASYGTQFDGKGTLLWNLEAGRMEGYEFGAESTINFEIGVNVDMQGASAEYVMTEERKGKIGVSVEVETVD